MPSVYDELSDNLIILYSNNREKELKDKMKECLLNYNIKYKYNDDMDIHSKIEMFLNAKKLEGLSKLTLDSYKLNLNIFAKYINKNIKNITTNDIREYLTIYDNYKVSSLSTIISTLKSFFNWLVGEEILEKDPMVKIKLPKKQKRIIKALTIEELEIIRDACETLRESALVNTMYATGCRLQEIVDMNKGDINWQDGSIKVIGKGDKERIVYLNYKAMYNLKKYLKSRNDNCEALFVTIRKPIKRLGNRAIQREIKNIADRTNINKNIHPHIFRHTLASLLLQQGADISTIQSILGHESLNTTQIYAQITEQHKHEEYKKYVIQ
jgi:integrase/recombinase XerD